MLQQTQVDRVVPKYERFLQRFPTLVSLARAPLSEAVRLWQGLGYNSRALRLKQLAVEVDERFGGSVPQDVVLLRTLPGMGPYTVAAVRAFAFDMDDAAIDTNVRRVVHRALHGLEFPPQKSVRALDEAARLLVPHGRGHDWNSALMDLGSAFCTARAPKCGLCPLRGACAAAPIDVRRLEAARRAARVKRPPQQALPFEKTARYARGRIIDRLRELPEGGRISLLDLHGDLREKVERTPEEFADLVHALVREGLVDARAGELALKD